jgi:glycine betaine/proline transport system substrate-binding protein
MNTRAKKLPALTAFLLSATALSVQAACPVAETIQIADASWTSGSTLAHLESKIIEHGFGCKTELIPGENLITVTTMVKKGRPHIAPEVWSSHGETKKMLAEGKEKGTAYVAGSVFAGDGISAWWVPKYVVEQYPDIKTVNDLARYSHLFKVPGSDKGRFYNSIPGWSSETRSSNLIRAYGLDQTFDVFSAGSGAALDAAIVSNYKRQKPIFFFYWAPSALLGKYDMVKLDMAPHDEANDSCNAVANCKKPVLSGFPLVAVNTVVVSTIKQDAPAIYQFLSKVQFENDKLNTLLAWGEDNKADPMEVAEHFLKNNQDIWTNWVPKDVAEKVIASLN